MPKKILIAEDERDIAQMLALRLEEAGYDVLIASSGPEAIALTKSGKPDLILLDFTLPKMNGDVVCRELKSDSNCARIPIILLSAYRQDQIDEHHEADAYLGKPYEAEELLEKIGELLLKTKL
ncbi:MAG: response regulator [Candidatus Omnitrophica bacterium]|nr:response regulator [Candidatus Omnitrophota bacterium]